MKIAILRQIVTLLKTKDEENVLKAARGKQITYRTIQNTPDFLSDAMEVRIPVDTGTSLIC